MFCPSCKDEFRPGFTRCASCDVDLVEDLSEAPPTPARETGSAPALRAIPMADYCGYFSLDEARADRDRLKSEGILSDIVIRASPESATQNPFGEEYWLRVDAAKYRQAAPILGFDSADSEGGKSMTCESCGEEVSREAAFCAKCGRSFGGT